MQNLFEFKEWLERSEISELTKLSHLDTSDVALSQAHPDDDNYDFDEPDSHLVHRFYHEGKSYIVQMDREYMSQFHGLDLRKPLAVWNINFQGPRAFALTGRDSEVAVGVYTRVLSAIKELMNTKQVDVITFSAFDPKMVPVYDRFVKTLLGDTFVMIPSSSDYKKYMRADRLREITALMSPEDKSQFDSASRDASNRQSEEVSKVRKYKLAMRKAVQEKRNIIGKVTGAVNSSLSGEVYPAIVKDITPRFIVLLVFNTDGRGDNKWYFLNVIYENYERKLRSPRLIDPQKLAKLSQASEQIKEEVPEFKMEYHEFETL